MTRAEASRPPQRVLVVLNPVAGQAQAEVVRQLLEATFRAHHCEHVIYETTGDDDVAAEIAGLEPAGLDLVVAAGGDGTVALVAHALVGHDLPLGILPLGTANVLALELGIPGDPAGAAELLVGEHRRRALDLMRVGNRHVVLQIGVGLDALMIRDTDRAAKRRLGRLAYLLTLAEKLHRHRARRFSLLVDGRHLRPRARQVLVANGGTLGTPPLRWGPDIAPDDGVLDLCIWQVGTPRYYLQQLWHLLTGRARQGPVLTYHRVHQQVVIAASAPLPVQADGEIIGETPVQVAVVPHAVQVIVPPER